MSDQLTPAPDAPACSAADLRDAYIAIGSAIAALRSMPMRRYAGDEEAYRVQSAAQSLDEARQLLLHARMPETQAAISLDDETRALGTVRAIARPLVWRWIHTLHHKRSQVAALITQRGESIPDDLPPGSWMERAAGSARGRVGLVLVTALIVALWIGFVMNLVFPAS